MSFEHSLTYKGETLPIAEWSRRTGIKDKTIYMRIQAGWSVEKTLERPLKRAKYSKATQDENHGEKEAAKERRLVLSYLKTQPSHIDERREEGDIL